MIRDVERLGGMVVTREADPPWIRQWVGSRRIRLIEDIEGIRLNLSSMVTDADLKCLRGVTELGWLDLEGDSLLTDAGMEHIQRLKCLGMLNLDRTRITDTGVARLNGLTNLGPCHLLAQT